MDCSALTRGAAPRTAAAPPTRADRALFALVCAALCFARLVCALLAPCARATRLLRRLARSALDLVPSRTAASAPAPFPPHVAFAGELRSAEHVLRLARAARARGALTVSVYDPADMLSLPSSQTTDKPPHVVRTTDSRAHALVLAARALASTPPANRPCIASDPLAVVDWLDTDPLHNMLPSEPDVLVIFTGPSRAHTLAGFPVWQLRLTQICFVDQDIADFGALDLHKRVVAASSAAKRFGA